MKIQDSLLKKIILIEIFFLKESFNLCRPLLQRLNPESFIQVSEILPIKLTETFKPNFLLGAFEYKFLFFNKRVKRKSQQSLYYIN